jgi:hypothetical protein
MLPTTMKADESCLNWCCRQFAMPAFVQTRVRFTQVGRIELIDNQIKQNSAHVDSEESRRCP